MRPRNADSDSGGRRGSDGPRLQGAPYRDADAGSGELPINEIDDFIVPARDEKGGSQRIDFYLPPFMARQIEIVVKSGRFPYVNKSDFLRHAALRHIRFCGGIRATIARTIIPALESALELCRDEEIKSRMEDIFNRVESLAAGYRQKGEHGEAIRLLNTVKAQLAGINPSVWQRKFLSEFYQRYAPYLAGVGPDKENGRGLNGHGHGNSAAQA